MSIAAGSAAEQLHGRPTVGAVAVIEVAVIVALVAWGLWRVLSARAGFFMYFAIGFFAITARCALIGGKARAALIGGMACAVVMLLGCGSSTPTTRTAGSAVPADLLAQARPIGHGERFHPPATGPVMGRCKSTLGSRVGAHVELFAANRVVLIAAGIGTRPPVSYSAGRIAKAHCYGDLVTLEPTGVVLVRRGSRLTLSDLFRWWGEPLSERRLASFSAGAGRRVRVYVDGRPRSGPPGAVPLSAHAEIVLEVGPHVPPHSAYTFPPGS